MKRGMTIIIGLAALCLLGVVYAGISYTKEQSVKNAEALLEAEKTYLTDMGAINYLSYDYDGTVLEFEKENDTWYYVPDHGIDLKQSELQSLADSIQKLEALRTLEGGDGLAHYGLSEPSKRITARDVDGNIQTVLIGDKTGDEVYACLEDQTYASVIRSGLKTKSEHSLEDLTDTETAESGDESSQETAEESGMEATK